MEQAAGRPEGDRRGLGDGDDDGDLHLQRAAQRAGARELKNELKVTIHDTPKDIFPAFIKATNLVYDREAGKNPFFKEVLESQRTFAKLVVPYWNKINGLYYNLGIESPNAK